MIKHARLALAGFLAVTLAAGPSAVGADSNGQREGDHHYVRGTATTKIDDSVTGRVTRTFVVTESDGAANGFIHERLREIDKNGAYTVKTRFVIEVDCLDVSIETGQAWIRGVITDVKGGVTLADGTYFDFPNVGDGVVYYADDNRGTGEPDVQGGIFTGEEWGNTVQSCEERPDPWIYDALTGGNLKVG